MVGKSAQTGQPVPLFYGLLTAGWNDQALESGYDYVITGIIFSVEGDAGAQAVALRDESSVQFFGTTLDSSGAAGPRTYEWSGELPIGPRTSLGIYGSTATVFAIISGYALSPPTALSV